jgi:hypothetical protein
MHDNTERLTMIINQALRLCNDFALQGARSHLYAALNETNKVAKKRERREIVQKQEAQERKLKEELRIKKMQELNKPQINTDFTSEEGE